MPFKWFSSQTSRFSEPSPGVMTPTAFSSLCCWANELISNEVHMPNYYFSTHCCFSLKDTKVEKGLDRKSHLLIFSQILKQIFIHDNTPRTRWNGGCPAVTRGYLRWIRGSTWWDLEPEGEWALREEDEIHQGELKCWGLPWWRCAQMLSQPLRSQRKRLLKEEYHCWCRSWGEEKTISAKGKLLGGFEQCYRLRILRKKK